MRERDHAHRNRVVVREGAAEGVRGAAGGRIRRPDGVREAVLTPPNPLRNLHQHLKLAEIRPLPAR